MTKSHTLSVLVLAAVAGGVAGWPAAAIVLGLALLARRREQPTPLPPTSPPDEARIAESLQIIENDLRRGLRAGDVTTTSWGLFRLRQLRAELVGGEVDERAESIRLNAPGGRA